jgi:hypothetical protein
LMGVIILSICQHKLIASNESEGTAEPIKKEDKPFGSGLG